MGLILIRSAAPLMSTHNICFYEQIKLSTIFCWKIHLIWSYVDRSFIIINALHVLASVTWLDARPTGDQEIAGSTPAVSVTFSWRFDHEIFSTVIPFRWFKKGSCQFLAKEYAQYGLTAYRTKPAQ